MSAHDRLLLLLLVCCGSAMAAVSVPQVFSDHAVLQRAATVPIWGTADPGEQVTVSLDRAKASAIAGADGRWRAALDLSALDQGPHTLVIAGRNTISIRDVVVGEVWLCAGQSNMAFPLRAAAGSAETIAAADNPQLREFRTPNVASPVPLDDVDGRWVVSSPATAGEFSAVGHHFALELHATLKRPVGIIHSSWGASQIQSWMSPASLDGDPRLKAEREQSLRLFGDATSYIDQIAAWGVKHQRGDRPPPPDLDPYTRPDADTSAWKRITLPGRLSDAGLTGSGAYWLRKTISVKPSTHPKHKTKSVFPFMPGDFNGDMRVYWNGELLEYYNLVNKKGFWATGQDGMARSGDITIALRMFSSTGAPLFNKSSLCTAGEVSLAGEWLVRAEFELPPPSATALAEKPRTNAGGMEQRNLASFPYNARIAPFRTYALAGAVWYQGESNTRDPSMYGNALTRLIQGWRQAWGREDLPFLICQLPNTDEHKPQPGESDWARLREEQSRALNLPHTGMVVLIDCGDGDLHPRNKQVVGDRLARLAQAQVYGTQKVGSGPVYTSMLLDGSRVRITWRNTDGGLVARKLDDTKLVRNAPQGDLEGFAISGDGTSWVWANAKIDGATVVVWSDTVQKPTAVRYAWADNPVVNLYNGAGLPAAPFRTDSKQ